MHRKVVFIQSLRLLTSNLPENFIPETWLSSSQPRPVNPSTCIDIHLNSSWCSQIKWFNCHAVDPPKNRAKKHQWHRWWVNWLTSWTLSTFEGWQRLRRHGQRILKAARRSAKSIRSLLRLRDSLRWKGRGLTSLTRLTRFLCRLVQRGQGRSAGQTMQRQEAFVVLVATQAQGDFQAIHPNERNPIPKTLKAWNFSKQPRASDLWNVQWIFCIFENARFLLLRLVGLDGCPLLYKMENASKTWKPKFLQMTICWKTDFNSFGDLLYWKAWKNKQTNKRTDEQTRKDHFPMDIPGCNRRCIILEITTAHIYIFRHLSAMDGVGIQRGTSWYNSIIVASNFTRLPHAAWQHQMFPPTSPLDVECRVERTRRSRAFAKEKCDRCDKHHHDYFPL